MKESNVVFSDSSRVSRVEEVVSSGGSESVVMVHRGACPTSDSPHRRGA